MLKNKSIIALLVVGHISILGKLVGSEIIQGLGFMTAASPLPLVFSKFRGVEGFASEFFVQYEDQGEVKEIHITPSVYDSLRGPYNRRNAYGAAIAGAPMLNQGKEVDMIAAVHEYGFCRGSLKREFGVPVYVKNLEIIIKSRITNRKSKTWIFFVDCHD